MMRDGRRYSRELQMGVDTTGIRHDVQMRDIWMVRQCVCHAGYDSPNAWVRITRVACIDDYPQALSGHGDTSHRCTPMHWHTRQRL